MTKSTVKKTAAKAEIKTPAVNAEAPRAEVKETVKETPVKAEPETKEVKAAPVKKTTAVKPAAEKKTSVKKTAPVKTEKPAVGKKAPVKKAADVKTDISIQFAGRDYTTEKLVQIAKDVWQYDLGKNPEDFKAVQLYVKPEENTVYYVINGDTTGNFAI